MELALTRPWVFEFNDRTQSKRPPREALARATTAASFLSRLIMGPVEDPRLAAYDLLPTLAFWGD